jgi:hypothetical protein
MKNILILFLMLVNLFNCASLENRKLRIETVDGYFVKNTSSLSDVVLKIKSEEEFHQNFDIARTMSAFRPIFWAEEYAIIYVGKKSNMSESLKLSGYNHTKDQLNLYIQKTSQSPQSYISQPILVILIQKNQSFKNLSVFLNFDKISSFSIP